MTIEREQLVCRELISAILEQAVADFRLLKAKGIIRKGRIRRDIKRWHVVGKIQRHEAYLLERFIQGRWFDQMFGCLETKCTGGRARMALGI